MTTHKEVIQQALDDFEHIQEYWNGNYSERAMSDALTHIIEVAIDGATALRAALAEPEVIRSEEGTCYYADKDGNPVDEPVGKKLQSLVDGCKETKYRRDIKTAVDRFLCWKLPKDFAPDAGISFDKQHEYDSYRWPIGTNLFTYQQAKAMFEHCLEGTGYIAYPQAPQHSLSDEDKLDAERYRFIRDWEKSDLRFVGIGLRTGDGLDSAIDAARALEKKPKEDKFWEPDGLGSALSDMGVI